MTSSLFSILDDVTLTEEAKVDRNAKQIVGERSLNRSKVYGHNTPHMVVVPERSGSRAAR
jgi:hypothetical protein